MKRLSMKLPPTMKQTKAIDKLVANLHNMNRIINIPHTPANRFEARDLIHKLRMERDKE